MNAPIRSCPVLSAPICSGAALLSPPAPLLGGPVSLALSLFFSRPYSLADLAALSWSSNCNLLTLTRTLTLTLTVRVVDDCCKEFIETGAKTDPVARYVNVSQQAVLEQRATKSAKPGRRFAQNLRPWKPTPNPNSNTNPVIGPNTNPDPNPNSRKEFEPGTSKLFAANS